MHSTQYRRYACELDPSEASRANKQGRGYQSVWPGAKVYQPRRSRIDRSRLVTSEGQDVIGDLYSESTQLTKRLQGRFAIRWTGESIAPSPRKTTAKRHHHSQRDRRVTLLNSIDYGLKRQALRRERLRERRRSTDLRVQGSRCRRGETIDLERRHVGHVRPPAQGEEAAL